MARELGFVYYEADCFANLKNPYIPLDTENPSMAQNDQKKLKDRDGKRISVTGHLCTILSRKIQRNVQVPGWLSESW